MRDSDTLGCTVIGGIVVIAILFQINWIDFIVFIFSKDFETHRYWSVFIVVITTLLFYIYRKSKKQKAELKEITEQCTREINKKETECQNAISVMQANAERQRNVWRIKESVLKSTINATKPFSMVAEMYAMVETYAFEEASSYLRTRPRNKAPKTADRIEKELKLKTKEHATKYAEMKYKYDFLLATFPDLAKYTDTKEEVENEIEEAIKYTHAEESYDSAKDWLTTEEYEKLGDIEKYQLALDRWVKSRKRSASTVGYDYEMYIAWLYKREGWQIKYNGIEFGKQDNGIDLIAVKLIGGKYHYLIIQCKYWKVSKVIHENVVCQTFGTAMEYRADRGNKLMASTSIVTPVVISTTDLSPTAQRFATYLGVKFKKIPMGDYPRIKCNINQGSGEKIYHLPFDQQYYRTQIKLPGESIVLTVKEAEAKGFRRALRHYY